MPNDLAILRDGIKRFHREPGKTKLLLSYLGLLLQSVKEETRASIAEGRAIERPALRHAIDVWFSAYVSIIGTCPQSHYWQSAFFTGLSPLLPVDDNPLPYVWRSIADRSFSIETADLHHREAVLTYRPGKRAAVEKCFYVDATDPEHTLYQEILRQEQGTFREEISLCRLAQQRFAQANDHIPVAQFTRMLNTLSKAGLSIIANQAEYATADDLDDIGAMLLARYSADFAKPDEQWREVLAAKLDSAILQEATGPTNQYFPNSHTWADDAKRGKLVATVLRLLYLASSDAWYSDALSLVRQFAVSVRVIIADGLDREAVLSRFVGASYPVARC